MISFVTNKTQMNAITLIHVIRTEMTKMTIVFLFLILNLELFNIFKIEV